VTIIADEATHQQCIECAIHFWVPRYFDSRRRADRRSFYCPNGHSQAYTESEADKLRRERDRLNQRLAQKDDEIRHQSERREAAERAAAAARGQVTKIKNRVGRGVCPCCNRTFENLARHMVVKHADYTQEAAE
jgi:hypothetical protein